MEREGAMKIHIELELTPGMKRAGLLAAAASVLLGGAVAYAQATALPAADHVKRAVISGTVVSQNGGWISRVDRPAQGLSVITFAPGAFASPPACVSVALAAEFVGTNLATAVGVTYPLGCLPATASSVTCQSRGGNTGYEPAISIICAGR
jgi:hypothetical protein